MQLCEEQLCEGAARFCLGASFYRPDSKLARDLGILAAQVYKHQTGHLRILDGMTGCGVRPLRYVLEADADFAWANDADPQVAPILSQNLAAQLHPDSYKITHQDTRRLLQTCYHHRDYYDLVDLDGFGNPAPHLQAAIGATRLDGLIYLTSTDGRTTSGQVATQVTGDCLRLLGAYSRSHPAHHEQGLRILIGAVAQQAGMLGLRVDPVFSLFRGQIYRLMLRLSRQTWQPEHSGFLGYCHSCGEFQTVAWRQLHQARCPHHQPPQPVVLSGPLWLGPLHDPEFLAQMLEQAQSQSQRWPEAQLLLPILQTEANLPPYFYSLGEIGRRGKLDIPPRDSLIAALQTQGHSACATHINPQAIKTTASLADCIRVAKELYKERL